MLHPVSMAPHLAVHHHTYVRATPTATRTTALPHHRPKPLNFGLDQRECDLLQRHYRAIQAIQAVISAPISDGNARAMLIASDYPSDWLNIANDSDIANDPSDSDEQTLR